MRSNQNLVYGTFSFGFFHKTNPYYAMVDTDFQHSHHTLFTDYLWPTATLKSREWDKLFLGYLIYGTILLLLRRMSLVSSLRAVTFGWRSWGNTWAFAPLFRLLILRWSWHLFCRSLHFLAGVCFFFADVSLVKGIFSPSVMSLLEVRGKPSVASAAAPPPQHRCPLSHLCPGPWKRSSS